MSLRAVLLLSLVFSASASSLVTAQEAQQQPAAQPAWQQDMARRHEALIQQNGPGTDAALRAQLLAMKQQDQDARGFRAGSTGLQGQIATDLAAIDQGLTDQLKQIFYAKGWPTIRLVGLDASNAAMLILTHTPDHAWQRSILPQLETLADSGKIDGSTLALVVDKELIASGQLQRYGSQFKFVNGAMAMYAVEDPATLDQRRAQVLLPPMDVYRDMLEHIYHLKASNQIVSATPPAAK